MNNATPSGSSYGIFYAPLLSAAGFTDGRWVMGIQINNNGWNNLAMCSSDRGCGIANQQADDQFLAGVSASGGGYWATYHTYSTLNNRALPLITQALYFPTGAYPVGATTNTGINPTSWGLAGSGLGPPARCTKQCYAAGDFNTPSSNPFAASNMTFVQQSPYLTGLFQSFQQDPLGSPNVPNFRPNYIPIAPGEDLSGLGKPVPPDSYALPPTQTRGFLTR